MSVPSFAGLSGPWLMRSVTATATMGFLLFGYDSMYSSMAVGAPANLFRGRHEWHHRRRTVRHGPSSGQRQLDNPGCCHGHLRVGYVQSIGLDVIMQDADS